MLDPTVPIMHLSSYYTDLFQTSVQVVRDPGSGSFKLLSWRLLDFFVGSREDISPLTWGNVFCVAKKEPLTQHLKRSVGDM